MEDAKKMHDYVLNYRAWKVASTSAKSLVRKHDKSFGQAAHLIRKSQRLE